MSPDNTKPGADQRSAPAGLTDLLLSSLDALAGAGEADTACRLAGQACAILRKNDPSSWWRFNALLHRLSKVVA